MQALLSRGFPAADRAVVGKGGRHRRCLRNRFAPALPVHDLQATVQNLLDVVSKSGNRHGREGRFREVRMANDRQLVRHLYAGIGDPGGGRGSFFARTAGGGGGFTAGRADDIVSKSGAAPKNISARMAA